MKNILFVILFSAFFSCTSSGGGTKYVVDGKIENLSGKKVILEKLSLQQIVAIDSATLDKDGKFKLSNYADKGFYRLRVDSYAWILLLENSNFKFTADSKDPIGYTVSGTEASKEMLEAVKYVSGRQMELQAANEEFYRRQNAGQSQDSLQQFAMQIQMAGQTFENTLKSRVSVSKEPFVSLYYVSFLPMNKYPKENGDVIKLMEKNYPNSEYTKEMKSAYAQIEMQMKAAEMKQKAEAATAIGSTAIDLDYPSPSGKNIKLSSLRGKVVLVDFWASWCGPCRRENPSVVAAYNKYKDKGFTVYSVSLDQDKSRWTSAIAQDGLIWDNHVSDLKGWSAEPAAKYGVQSIPAQFLLDKDGKIIAKNLRGEELDRKLEEILK